MNYDVVIGIEIHCELKTKTKMFSSAPVAFAKQANSCVNEVDLAHPGTLPALNKKAVELALRACYALDCSIDTLVKFDRKNYYYSDLPKGYQITQQFFPIGSNGNIEIDVDGYKKNIRINRIHMEEDTAKQNHNYDGTYIDYNRAGTPLIEIVSEADMSSGDEACAYVKKIKTILYYLGVSDVKMEEGSMRCDVNISLRKSKDDPFGVKTEIKNINSISYIAKAIESEIVRQSTLLDNNETIVQETRRYDEATRSTISMRKKEGNVDYKYFPDPNIVPIKLNEQWVKDILDNLPQLPVQRKDTYINKYGLSEVDADILVEDKELSDFYNIVVKDCNDYKSAANWVITSLNAILNKTNKSISDLAIKPKHLAELVNMINNNDISSKQAKIVFEDMLEGKDPKSIVEEKGMKQVSDSNAILQIVIDVLDNNAQSIEDYKNGKDRAVGYLVGQVMKASKGQANPSMSNKLILEELKKR